MNATSKLVTVTVAAVTTAVAGYLVFKCLQQPKPKQVKDQTAIRPPVDTISHVTIRVSSLERSVAFYEKMGLTTVGQSCHRQQFMTMTGAGTSNPLVLLQEDPTMATPRGPVYSEGMTRLCMMVLNLDALVSSVAKNGLNPAYGHHIVRGRGLLSVDLVCYKDPDEFIIYFFQFQLYPLRILIQFLCRLKGLDGSVPYHWTVNASDRSKACDQFHRLGFQTTSEIKKDCVHNELLPAFGFQEWWKVIVEDIYMMSLPRGNGFQVCVMEWTSPRTIKTGLELSNSLSISVANVHEALKLAREAGLVVTQDPVRRTIPAYGNGEVGTAYLDEASNPIEFVAFSG